MRRVRLYTKPGCHLCDAAYELLLAVACESDEQLRIKTVNILEDPALYLRYRELIPVVAFDPDVGGPTLNAPITESDVRRLLCASPVCANSADAAESTILMNSPEETK